MSTWDNYPAGFREPSLHYDSKEKLYYMDNGSISSDIEYYLDEDCAILHRVEGPALDYAEPGASGWYYHGNHIPVSSQEEFEEWLKYNAFV